MELLNDVLQNARPDGDALLRARALMDKLSLLNQESDEYISLSDAAFKISPAFLRNYGLPLPVNVTSKDDDLVALLKGSPFLVVNNKDLKAALIYDNISNPPTLAFLADSGSAQKSTKVSGSDLTEIINKLADAVFTQKL